MEFRTLLLWSCHALHFNCPPSIRYRTFLIFGVRVLHELGIPWWYLVKNIYLSKCQHPASGNSKYWPLGNLSWPKSDPRVHFSSIHFSRGTTSLNHSRGPRTSLAMELDMPFWPWVNYKCHTYLRNCLWILGLCSHWIDMNWWTNSATCVALDLRVPTEVHLMPIWISHLFGLHNMVGMVVKQNVMYWGWQRYFRNKVESCIKKCSPNPTKPIVEGWRNHNDETSCWDSKCWFSAFNQFRPFSPRNYKVTLLFDLPKADRNHYFTLWNKHTRLKSKSKMFRKNYILASCLQWSVFLCYRHVCVCHSVSDTIKIQR